MFSPFGFMETQVALIPFTPADITTTFWLDANDGSTLALSGTDVTSWTDKSGNNIVFTTSGGTVTYSATSMNGMPGLSWPGTTNSSKMKAGTSFSLIEYICMVTYDDGVQATWRGSYQGLITGPANINNDVITIGETSGFNVLYNGSLFGDGYKNGGSDTNYLTNVVLPLNASILDLYDTSIISTTFQLGMDRTNSSRGWFGTMAEFIGTDTRWDTTTRQKLEGYLAWKWGVVGNLPAIHPYKNYPPSA